MNSNYDSKDMGFMKVLYRILNLSIEQFYCHDKVLIELGMEQACVARIFYYMQRLIDLNDEFKIFSKYNLDCEYYKFEEEKKRIPRLNNGIRPDIILHKRKVKDNLLVIEFKTYKNSISENATRMDFTKLLDLTRLDGVYAYKLGVYIELKNEFREISYIFFYNGFITALEDIIDA